MKKLQITYIFLLSVFLFSCNSNNNVNSHIININNLNFKDTDILYEVLSKKDGYIKKIRLFLKIDDRLKNLSHISDVKLIDLGIGGKASDIKHLYLYTQYSKETKNKNAVINQKNDILIVDLNLHESEIKNINIIIANFFLENTDNKIIENTDYFYYEKSCQLLGLSNTFMDSSGFKNTNVLIKTLASKNKYLDNIGLTVKLNNQEIDSIKNIEIDVWFDKNLYKLKFTHSIYDGSVIENMKSNQCVLTGSSRPGKNYLYYEMNILSLKLIKIDSLVMKLDNELYYSNRL